MKLQQSNQALQVPLGLFWLLYRKFCLTQPLILKNLFRITENATLKAISVPKSTE